MKNKVLLIADDDEMNRTIIRRFLKNEFEILEAADGKEAMEVLNHRHVDALLLDIIMPEMDGFEVLKLIKDNKEMSAIGILVATSTKEKTERMALELGADDVVSKPYDPIVIRKRMENILAVKEVNIQKDFLKNNDIESLLNGQKEALQNKAEQIAGRICQLTDAVKDNIGNEELVCDILAKINDETQNILNICE